GRAGTGGAEGAARARRFVGRAQERHAHVPRAGGVHRGGGHRAARERPRPRRGLSRLPPGPPTAAQWAARLLSKKICSPSCRISRPPVKLKTYSTGATEGEHGCDHSPRQHSSKNPNLFWPVRI